MYIELKEKILGTRVDLYKDEIRKRNYNSFKGFLIVGAIISLTVLLFGLILSHLVTFNTELFIMFCYFLILYIITETFLKKKMKYITVAFYTALTPLMILTILMGTFLDRNEPSITIMVFICVLTLFILDKPWRVLLYITSVAIVYCICCYLAKDYNMFMADLFDLIAFYFLAMGVNYFTLSDRIDSVENYVRYRDKSEIDLLTNIYNRGTGVEKIKQLIDQKIYGSFIIIDIDQFKHINDNYGHMAGDEVLKSLSNALKEHFKEDDIIFRMGGDEFIVYSVGLTNEKQCIECLDKLFCYLKNVKIKSINNYTLSISIGCSIFEKGVSDYNQLYRSSDKSLYRAKKSGRGCYKIN